MGFCRLSLYFQQPCHLEAVAAVVWEYLAITHASARSWNHPWDAVFKANWTQGYGDHGNFLPNSKENMGVVARWNMVRLPRWGLEGEMWKTWRVKGNPMGMGYLPKKGISNKYSSKERFVGSWEQVPSGRCCQNSCLETISSGHGQTACKIYAHTFILTLDHFFYLQLILLEFNVFVLSLILLGNCFLRPHKTLNHPGSLLAMVNYYEPCLSNCGKVIIKCTRH